MNMAEVAANMSLRIFRYMYGSTPVPFDDVELANGEKGLRCLGFAKTSSIQIEHLEGSSTRMVVPQTGADSSAKRFGALLAAMRDLDSALIARYTYSNRSAPKIMALFPHDDNSMLMHELFFKENMVLMTFPSLESHKFTPTDEQNEFMDKFIDSMDLTGSTQFDQLMDPGVQHIYRVLAHRAINPEDPLVAVDKSLLALITPPTPKGIDIDEMKTLFPLQEIERSNKEKWLENIQNLQSEAGDNRATSLQDGNDIDITSVGTIRPAEDFLLLLAKGEHIDRPIRQLQDVIVQLAIKSVTAMDDKICKALDAYRENAKQKCPYKYNDYIQKFKDVLKEREKVQLWEMIVKERLGLITERESEISTVTDANAAAFYQGDEFYTQLNQSADIRMEDNDDLLDQL